MHPYQILKKSNEQKQKIDKIFFSNKPPRATFGQLKETKNPSKISLLLHTKQSKWIFKITSELSTMEERFLLQKLSIKQKICLLFAYNKKVQSLSVASVTVSFNDERRLSLNTPLSGWGRQLRPTDWHWGFKLFRFGDFWDWVMWVSGCEPLRVNLSLQSFLVHVFISLK